MVKKVPFKKLYTSTGERFADSVFSEIGYEFLAIYPEDITKTRYYEFLMDLLKKRGEVWGTIKTERDVYTRVLKYQAIFKNIEKEGYDPELGDPLKIINGKIYGGVTGTLSNRGCELIDGHHRASILYALGHKYIEVIICE